jgi:hypothetical protein
MDKIYTGYVLDPTIAQPFTSNSLEFLQEATADMIGALAQSTVGIFYSPGGGIPYIMSGCANNGNGYDDGVIFYNGALYLVNGIYKPGSIFTHVPVCTITTANSGFADPLTFTDGIPRNVHNVIQIFITDAVSGSGDFDFGDAYYIDSGWIKYPITSANLILSAGTLNNYHTGDLTFHYHIHYPYMEFMLVGSPTHSFAIDTTDGSIEIDLSGIPGNHFNLLPGIQPVSFLGSCRSSAGGTQLITLACSEAGVPIPFGHFVFQTISAGYLFTHGLTFSGVSVIGTMPIV